MSISKYVYVPRKLSDSLAQLDRRIAAEKAYRGILSADSTTTTKVHELSIHNDANSQISGDAEECQILEPHENTVGNAPHTLESLEQIRSPNEEGTSYNSIHVEGAAGRAGRGECCIDTVCNVSGEPPMRTAYVRVPLLHPFPQGPQVRRPSESVQWLQDVSVTPTVTHPPSVTAPSSEEVFVTAPNSPGPSDLIVSTTSNSEGTCEKSAPVDSSLVSHPCSQMTSLLPRHTRDLKSGQHGYGSIPGSFPFAVDDEQNTQNGTQITLPLLSVNNAPQTLGQTCGTTHAVNTLPSDLLGGQLHKPSGGQTRQRHSRRLIGSDDPWRRGK